ncbi:hypothetical protein ACTXGJ_08380 [Psychrobacter sp. 1Y11]|uniref:hypothetical protein n=1 Tax=Psychrobacter sp. 1Y11 TaxID=3457446 RepID=UPI003FD1C6BE
MSMSVVKNKWMKWQQIAGISLVCGLAVAGCSRPDDEDSVDTTDVSAEQQATGDADIAPAMRCDDPMVQDRLRTALMNTLDQQTQTLATNYANNAEVAISSSMLDTKVGNIKIDVQNAAILQEGNASGMTTCQASVSMTLPSEDLYQASLIDSSNNKPSLQSRLANENIRINNNMLVDDAFSYVIGAQNGLVQARIAGQPALIRIVADVMAGSSLKTMLDEQAAIRRAEAAAARRAAASSREENQTIRQPRTVTPVEPIRQATPPTPPAPPTINQNNNANNDDESVAAASTSTDNRASTPVKPALPKAIPEDKSIDMIIVEDDSATY